MSYLFPSTYNDDVQLIKWRLKVNEIKLNRYEYNQHWGGYHYVSNQASQRKTERIQSVSGIVTLYPPGWTEEELSQLDMMIVFHKGDKEDLRRPRVLYYREYQDKHIDAIREVGEGNFCYVWGKICKNHAPAKDESDYKFEFTTLIKDLYGGKVDPEAAFLHTSNRDVMTELTR